jgi:hypothetical protein
MRPFCWLTIRVDNGVLDVVNFWGHYAIDKAKRYFEPKLPL